MLEAEREEKENALSLSLPLRVYPIMRIISPRNNGNGAIGVGTDPSLPALPSQNPHPTHLNFEAEFVLFGFRSSILPSKTAFYRVNPMSSSN